MDDDAEPRDFNETILQFRKNIVMQMRGNITMAMKEHLDNMVGIFLFIQSTNLKIRIFIENYKKVILIFLSKSCEVKKLPE